jgi:hypothetical protein
MSSNQTSAASPVQTDIDDGAIDEVFKKLAYCKRYPNCYQTEDSYNITVILEPLSISADNIPEEVITKALEPMNIVSNRDKMHAIEFITLYIHEIFEEYQPLEGFDDDGKESDDFDSDDEDFMTKDIKNHLPKVETTHDAMFYMHTWGMRKRKKLPEGIDKNFNAAVVNGKRRGANIKRYDGRTIGVQYCVVRGNNFYDFFLNMINTMEVWIKKHKESGKVPPLHFGVNCSAGRHRCVTCAELLKKYYYPNLVLDHMELRGK